MSDLLRNNSIHDPVQDDDGGKQSAKPHEGRRLLLMEQISESPFPDRLAVISVEEPLHTFTEVMDSDRTNVAVSLDWTQGWLQYVLEYLEDLGFIILGIPDHQAEPSTEFLDFIDPFPKLPFSALESELPTESDEVEDLLVNESSAQMDVTTGEEEHAE